MITDVAGRVRNVQLPASKPLLPLFEAIINSIHAIEDVREEAGQIAIEVVRDATSVVAGSERWLAEITGFLVKDNGVGFDEQNFQAFSTSDTTYKASRGGKGIGRFMWLAAFESVEIDSVFGSNGSVKRRQFKFCPHGSGIENPSCVDDPKAKRLTTVRLLGFKEKYRTQCPKRLETIAAFIVEEFLEYFIGPKRPSISLSDTLTKETLLLDDFFDSEMAAKSSQKQISVKGSILDVLHVRLYSNHINEHRLHLCAQWRAVTQEKLTGRIPNLIRRFYDENNKEFVYAAYVGSPVLDAGVNPDRTGFNLPEDASELMVSEITLSDIRKAVYEECKAFLAPYTSPVADKKRERIQKFIETEGAMYRPIIKRLEQKIDAIDPEAGDDEIDRRLYEGYHELQVQLRSEGQKLMESPCPDDAGFDKFREQA